MANRDSALSSSSLPLNTPVHLLSIKLSSSNYLVWRSQVVPVLTSYDLLSHVDGSSVALPTSIDSDGKSIPNPTFTS